MAINRLDYDAEEVRVAVGVHKVGQLGIRHTVADDVERGDKAFALDTVVLDNAAEDRAAVVVGTILLGDDADEDLILNVGRNLDSLRLHRDRVDGSLSIGEEDTIRDRTPETAELRSIVGLLIDLLDVVGASKDLNIAATPGEEPRRHNIAEVTTAGYREDRDITLVDNDNRLTAFVVESILGALGGRDIAHLDRDDAHVAASDIRPGVGHLVLERSEEEAVGAVVEGVAEVRVVEGGVAAEA